MALPVLSDQQPIADTRTGRPTSQFKRFMDETRSAQLLTDDQQAALLAEMATFLADLATQIARINRGFIAISHVDGLVIGAESDGATAKIAINDHTRVYIDRSVAVTGDVLTGLAYDTTYAIFYDDEARAGGAVVYETTLNSQEAVTGAAHPVRHLVGVVTTPATLADPPTGGGGTRPPGYPPGDSYVEP